MAAPKAAVLDGAGKSSKELTLDDGVFGADVKPHLVHEAVRAELNARRAGTQSAKTRGLVAGGRAKPWRQKGTGRARAGTIRAPQFVGGGVAFAPQPRSYEVKVNKKAYRSALRGALSAHASAGTLGVVDGSAFDEPSTKKADRTTRAWVIGCSMGSPDHTSFSPRPPVVSVDGSRSRSGLLRPDSPWG